MGLGSVHERARGLGESFEVQGLGTSDCKTELSGRNMLADSGTDQTVQRTLVA